MVDEAWRWLRHQLDHEYSAAVTLSAGVATALTWSAFAPASYFSITTGSTMVAWARQLDASSLHQFTLDALMAVFFYAIGLELRREIQRGTLARWHDALAPLAGALGGMLATAGASLLLGAWLRSAPLRHGWGVPMATDVAFTLGALALVGRRLPAGLRLFVLTLAIADDVFSVVILLFTGATHLQGPWIAAAACALVASWWLGRRYLPGAVSVALFAIVWFCFVRANLEPALAGVASGILVNPRSSAQPRLERASTRLATALVLPAFSLVAVGLHWSHLSLNAGGRTVIFSTVVIRLLGKALGITGGVWLAVRGGARMPPNVTEPMLIATSVLCAMGFTVPLLFAARLFSPRGATYGAFSLGLLLATLLAGLIGGVSLRLLSLTRLKEL